MNWLSKFWMSSWHLQLTLLQLDKGNRMFRIGFGQNNYRWFIRIDLWWIGFRLSSAR